MAATDRDDDTWAPAAGRAAPGVPAGQRVYAIGDVHGRLDLFEELVGLIRRDSDGRGPAEVRLLLLGDLIDRGPESAATVQRCMGFASRTDRFTVLKGNHEALMMDALAGDFDALTLWLEYGGKAALISWGVAMALADDGPSTQLLREARAVVPEPTRRWLHRLPLSHRSGDYLFVHAGIRPGIALAEQRDEDLLWIRDEFLDSEADHSVVVVHGHTISDAVQMRANRIGIDTGAYCTGVLSAVGLEGQERWVLATGGVIG